MKLKVLWQNLPYTLKMKHISSCSRYSDHTVLTISRENPSYADKGTVTTPSLHSHEEIHLIQLKVLQQHLPYMLCDR